MTDSLDNALAAVDLYREASGPQVASCRWDAESAITAHAAAWAAHCLNRVQEASAANATKLDDILLRSTFDRHDIEFLRDLAKRLRKPLSVS